MNITDNKHNTTFSRPYIEKRRENFFKNFTKEARTYLKSNDDNSRTVSKKINFIADSLFPREAYEQLKAYHKRLLFSKEVKKLDSEENTYSARLNEKYRALFRWIETREPIRAGNSSTNYTVVKFSNTKNKKASKKHYFMEIHITASDKQNQKRKRNAQVK